MRAVYAPGWRVNRIAESLLPMGHEKAPTRDAAPWMSETFGAVHHPVFCATTVWFASTSVSDGSAKTPVRLKEASDGPFARISTVLGWVPVTTNPAISTPEPVPTRDLAPRRELRPRREERGHRGGRVSARERIFVSVDGRIAHRPTPRSRRRWEAGTPSSRRFRRDCKTRS